MKWCLAEGCETKVKAKGMCNRHYLEALRRERGAPPSYSESLAERLERRSCHEPNTGCILWEGAQNGVGYGVTRSGGRQVTTHRSAWELAHGPIPEGMVVRHKCDTPPCLNVDHLELGTLADNSQDMVRRGRAARAVLEPGQVRQVRERFASGESIASIARDMGVGWTTAKKAATGKTWRHITE